jgi:hypothetical protein
MLTSGTIVRFQAQAESRDKYTHHRLSHIGRSQTYQIKLLHTIDDQARAQIRQIDGGEQRLQAYLESQALRLTAMEEKLATLVRRLMPIEARC